MQEHEKKIDARIVYTPTEIKKLLTKQLKMLSEKSETANAEELCRLTSEMVNLCFAYFQI